MLFIAMFAYDLIGVFATETITNVAKAVPLDLPIKLVVPHWEGGGASMVGLGDLIIPGIMCSFLSRIDYINEFLAKK